MARPAVLLFLLGGGCAAHSLTFLQTSKAAATLQARAFLRAHAGQPQQDQLSELKQENPEAFAIVTALLMKRQLGILDPHHPTTSFNTQVEKKSSVSAEDKAFLTQLETEHGHPPPTAKVDDTPAATAWASPTPVQESASTAFIAGGSAVPRPSPFADSGKDPFAWKPTAEDDAVKELAPAGGAALAEESSHAGRSQVASSADADIGAALAEESSHAGRSQVASSAAADSHVVHTGLEADMASFADELNEGQSDAKPAAAAPGAIAHPKLKKAAQTLAEDKSLFDIPSSLSSWLDKPKGKL